MPRDSFQQELDNLVAGMLELGRQVEASLENMVGAMERRDAGLAGKELGVDARYKARGADIDNKNSVLQGRQARSPGTSGCSTRCGRLRTTSSAPAPYASTSAARLLRLPIASETRSSRPHS